MEKAWKYKTLAVGKYHETVVTVNNFRRKINNSHKPKWDMKIKDSYT